MKLVFMGTPDFAAVQLQALLDANIEVAAVFTKEDKPVGRGHKLAFSPVKELAMKHDIPVYQPHRVRDEEPVRILRELSPELIVVAAFGQIIPKEILELPEYGCVNVHASLLPAYRGAAPIQWAVLNGDETSGVTIMQMAEGLDTGDILTECVVRLDPKETGGSLFDRLAEEGAKLLVETIPKLAAGQITPRKQPEKSTTPYARMIKKSDGKIDWTKDAVVIERQIRGLNPWPSAYSTLGGKQVKLWEAEVLPEDSGLAPGSVFHVDQTSFSVQTGRGALRVLELQLTGKKRMRADAFLRGHALKEGDCFETE